MEDNLKYTIRKVIVRRAVKIATGSYQNTDFDITLEATCATKDAEAVSESLLNEIDKILAPRIKNIKSINPTQFGISSK